MLVKVIVFEPGTAAREPPPNVQVPPSPFGVATTKPAGRVSVKVKVWVGLPVGWATVKVNVVLPPTGKSAANALFTVGTAGVTVTHAPALGTTPLVALGVTAAVMLVVVLILLLVLAFGASVHAPTVGAAAVVTSTKSVQVCAGLVIWLLVNVIVLVPATAVRDPPPKVQVPPKLFGVAITRPAGNVSVKLNVCVGLVAGCVTVNVRRLVPPTTRLVANTLLTVGTA